MCSINLVPGTMFPIPPLSEGRSIIFKHPLNLLVNLCTNIIYLHLPLHCILFNYVELDKSRQDSHCNTAL